MVVVGLIGKTNVGKTTFFNAATLLNAKISSYPFTTKTPNRGIAYARTICVCRELGVKDNPRNSACIDGWRYIPIELIDIPGLIKGAYRGRGLGNLFLNAAAQSDVLIHVVDASGSIDRDGNIVKPGYGDPIQDIIDVEEELVKWFADKIQHNMKSILKKYRKTGLIESALYKVLSGLKISIKDIVYVLDKTGLVDKKLDKWDKNDIYVFAKNIREKSKPTLILANKMDLKYSEENFRKISERFKNKIVIPCSAEAELALRRADKMNLIKYIPGGEKIKIIDDGKLSVKQKMALKYVSGKVLDKIYRTGVQLAIDTAIFKLLGMNTVYPVYDIERYADSKGNVLPDVYLLPPNSTLIDLARIIHTDLAKGLLYGIDAKTGLRIPKNYVLRDRDVIKIVTASRERKK